MNTYKLEYTQNKKKVNIEVSAVGFLGAVALLFPGACKAHRTKVVSMSQIEKWSVSFGYRDEIYQVLITRI